MSDRLTGWCDSGPEPNAPTNLDGVMEACGVTDQALASRLGVDRSTVSRWRRKTLGISVEQIVRVAGVLDCSVDELLGVKR